MVKFFLKKNGNLDMFKAIGTLVIFSGLLILALTWAVEARSKADKACFMADNLEQKVDRIDRNVEKLVDLHTSK